MVFSGTDSPRSAARLTTYLLPKVAQLVVVSLMPLHAPKRYLSEILNW